MKKLLMVVVVMVVCSLAPLAQAELVDRGNGMIYDTDFNITWYANAKMANLRWSEATAWAASLNVNGITGWRLPSALNLDGTGPCLPQPPDTAAFCKMSEFGHLYSTELGNIFGEGGADSYGPFAGTARWFYYWTGTTHATDSTRAYMFSPGGESFIAKKEVDTGFGWAVHDGDPAGPPPVVVPPTPVVDPVVVPPPPPVVVPPTPVVEPVVCPTPPVCPVCPAVVPPTPIPVVHPTLVGIDVHQRHIEYNSRGKIRVSILSSKTFHAPTMVDIGSLTFGRTGSEDSLAFCHRYSKDVNHDKYPDLVCEFHTSVTDFQCNDTEGFLNGNDV
jgi:hypothetical protein